MSIRLSIRRSVCCLVALPIFACGTSETSDADVVKLALIPKTGNNLVFEIGNSGAQFAATYAGEDDGRQVEVEYMAPADLDPELQRSLIRQAIDDKKDGLIVSCVDESIAETIDEAVAAGIPVITYDSDCPTSQRLGFYSMMSEDTGLRGADLLVEAMGTGSKTVAILTGRAGADNLERRAKAFEDRLADKYPDVTVIETINCAETGESCGSAIEDDIVDKYPDLDGLFVVGLWGLLDACSCSESGLTCVCEDTQMPKWKAAAKGKLKTVSYDSMPFQLELMKQGYVSALLGQKYFGWGYDSVGLMYDHLVHKKAVADFVDSGFDVVCPNNVDEMEAKWSSADFTVPLAPECEL